MFWFLVRDVRVFGDVDDVAVAEPEVGGRLRTVQDPFAFLAIDLAGDFDAGQIG